MSSEHDAAIKGVSEAWDFWLSQHDVSTPECIVEAVGQAFTGWLNTHSDELIAAIAQAAADRHAPPGGGA